MVTYGDGVSDVDLGKLLAFHRAHGRLATVTAVRPPARFGGLVFDGDLVAEFTEKPQIGEGWINGGFFVFEPAVFDYLDGDDTSLEADALERLARRGPARRLPARRLLAVHGHAPRQAAPRVAVGDRATRRGRSGVNALLAGPADARHRRDRPRRRLARPAPARRRGRRRLPRARLGARRASSSAAACSSSVKVVRGDVRDQALLERVLGEYEIDTVIHLAAQTIVGIANRNPVSTFETNIRGTWALLEACRRSPTVKQIVVASSDKAYGDQDVLPVRRGRRRSQGRHPYDVSKSCADLIAQAYADDLRPAGRRSRAAATSTAAAT